MKLRNKLAAITAAAMLAFTGVGFAAWTFNNSDAQTQNVSTYVTSAIEAKNVEVSGNTTVYLVLDQAKPYWSTAVNTGSKPIELTDGKITVTPKYEVIDQNDGASWTWTVSSNMNVASAISTYVTVGSFAASSAETGTITAASGNDQIAAIDYNLPTLSYVEAQKPTSLESYNAMVSALNSSVITFTFNCSFAEN